MEPALIKLNTLAFSKEVLWVLPLKHKLTEKNAIFSFQILALSQLNVQTTLSLENSFILILNFLAKSIQTMNS